jgi:TIR domain
VDVVIVRDIDRLTRNLTDWNAFDAGLRRTPNLRLTNGTSTDPTLDAGPTRHPFATRRRVSACTLAYLGRVVAMPGPVAFMSYARFDDQHDDGWITWFREQLSAEVRAQTGNDFAIFQDRDDIAWGQNWKRRIDETLDTVTLLIAIITPSFFRSQACRDEVSKFLDREGALGRDDLILPVYYIGTREMDDPAAREADDMARVLASRQLADWRELRFKPTTSPQVRRAIAKLAARMRDTFWQSPVASTARPAGSAHTAESPAGSAAQAEGADKTTAKTAPPTYTADADQQANGARSSRGQHRLRYVLLGTVIAVLVSGFAVLGIKFPDLFPARPSPSPSIKSSGPVRATSCPRTPASGYEVPKPLESPGEMSVKVCPVYINDGRSLGSTFSLSGLVVGSIPQNERLAVVAYPDPATCDLSGNPGTGRYAEYEEINPAENGGVWQLTHKAYPGSETIKRYIYFVLGPVSDMEKLPADRQRWEKAHGTSNGYPGMKSLPPHIIKLAYITIRAKLPSSYRCTGT